MKQIELILNGFDFKSVHEYYVKTNWNWINNGVPTIEKLKENAQYLLQKVYFDTKESCMLGTGGFYAYKFSWGLKLSFEPINYQQSF